jgi:K+-transporting ATPase ATPase C chain
VANANDQAASVAKARGVDPATVQQLIKDNTTGRALGFLGEEYVNVVNLNRALDKLHPVSTVNS